MYSRANWASLGRAWAMRMRSRQRNSNVVWRPVRPQGFVAFEFTTSHVIGHIADTFTILLSSNSRGACLRGRVPHYVAVSSVIWCGLETRRFAWQGQARMNGTLTSGALVSSKKQPADVMYASDALVWVIRALRNACLSDKTHFMFWSSRPRASIA